MKRGFSLVEVTLALGIMTFCLISVFSLLPVGLSVTKSAADEAAAISILDRLATDIRNGRTNALGEYEFGGTLGVTVAPGAQQIFTNAFSETGTAVSRSQARFLMRTEVRAPSNGFSTGSALVSVAWPAAGNANWQGTNWTNAQGFVSTRILYLPMP